MGALVPPDDLPAPSRLVPDDDLPAAGPQSPSFGQKALNMIGRGAWALPGLVGLDHEAVQAWATGTSKEDQRKLSRQVDAENPITSGLVRGVAAAPGEALTWALAPEVKAAQGAKFLEKAATYGPRLGVLAGASEYGSTASRDPVSRLGGAATAAAAGTVLGGLGAGVLPNPGALAPAKTAAERLRETAINQGRKVLTGNANPLATKVPLSEEAIRAAYDAGAIRPLGTVEKAATRLDVAREQVGAEYGQIVRALEAAGVKGPDVRNLAAALRSKGANVAENSVDTGAPELFSRVANEIGGATIPQHHGPPIIIPPKAPGAGQPPRFEAVATNLDWPAPPNLELPFPQRQTVAGPTASVILPESMPIAYSRAVDLAPTEVPPRLIPGTSRPASGSGWGPLFPTNDPAPIPVSQDLAFQGSMLPKLKVPDRPKPTPVSTEIRFRPGTPDDWNMRLGQAENVKRSLQQKAKYDRVQGDDVMMGARKDAASVVRQANEDAIAAQEAIAPDLAAAFIPVKQRLGPLIEASNAADIAAARAANRQQFGLGSKVLAGGALASGNVPGAVATMLGATALRNRGPATLGWAANTGAKLLSKAKGPAKPTTVTPEVEALLAYLREAGVRLVPAGASDEEDPR